MWNIIFNINIDLKKIVLANEIKTAIYLFLAATGLSKTGDS